LQNKTELSVSPSTSSSLESRFLLNFVSLRYSREEPTGNNADTDTFH